MLQRIKKFVGRYLRAPEVEMLEHRDGLLTLTSASPLPLTQTFVKTMTQAGELRAYVNILSYDPGEKLYRAQLDDSRVDLKTLQVERRDGVRVARVLKVASPDLPSREARTEDISMSGLRLATRTPLENGQRMELTVYLAHPDIPPLRVVGEVRWSAKKADHSYHSGIRFCGLHQAQMIALQRFMKKRLHS